MYQYLFGCSFAQDVVFGERPGKKKKTREDKLEYCGSNRASSETDRRAVS